MSFRALPVRWRAELGDHVISLAWSPDSQQFAAASVSGPIARYAASAGPGAECAGHGLGTTAIRFHPSGAWLASAGQDGQIRAWYADTLTPRWTAPAGASWAEHLAFRPDGAYLATAAGKSLRFFSPEGALAREVKEHTSTIASLAWLPSGAEVATAAYGAITGWSPIHEAPSFVLARKGSPLVLAPSPDGRYLAAGDQENAVQFWIIKRRLCLLMSGYAAKVRSLSWTSGSRYLATSGGQEVSVWDCGGPGPEGRAPALLRGHSQLVTAVSFQHKGPLLATAAEDGLCAVWRPAQDTSRPLFGLALTQPISALAWSPDDRLLAVGGALGQVALVEVPAP